MNKCGEHMSKGFGPKMSEGDWTAPRSWARKDMGETRPNVDRFKSYTQLLRNDKERGQPWQTEESLPKDRHIGLYSPECTVTYTPFSRSPPRPTSGSGLLKSDKSVLGGLDNLTSLYLKDKMQGRENSLSQTRQAQSMQLRSRSPIFPSVEDREVYDIVHRDQPVRYQDDSSYCDSLFRPLTWESSFQRKDHVSSPSPRKQFRVSSLERMESPDCFLNEPLKRRDFARKSDRYDRSESPGKEWPEKEDTTEKVIRSDTFENNEVTRVDKFSGKETLRDEWVEKRNYASEYWFEDTIGLSEDSPERPNRTIDNMLNSKDRTKDQWQEKRNHFRDDKHEDKDCDKSLSVRKDHTRDSWPYKRDRSRDDWSKRKDRAKDKGPERRDRGRDDRVERRDRTKNDWSEKGDRVKGQWSERRDRARDDWQEVKSFAKDYWSAGRDRRDKWSEGRDNRKDKLKDRRERERSAHVEKRDERYDQTRDDFFEPFQPEIKRLRVISPENVLSKSSNLSAIPSPPPPPTLSFQCSPPHRIATDYSKPLPFKSSLAVAVEKVQQSLHLSEKIKKKHKILSKCEIKIGELYRKKSKLLNEPSAFFPSIQKTIQPESNFSPVAFVQNVSLNFNSTKIPVSESEKAFEDLCNFNIRETVDKENEIALILPQTLITDYKLPGKSFEQSSSDGQRISPDCNISPDRLLCSTQTAGIIQFQNQFSYEKYYSVSEGKYDSKGKSGFLEMSNTISPTVEMTCGAWAGPSVQEYFSSDAIPFEQTKSSMEYFGFDQEQPLQIPWNKGSGWPSYSFPKRNASQKFSHSTSTPSILTTSPDSLPQDPLCPPRDYYRSDNKPQISLNLLSREVIRTSTSEDTEYVDKVEKFIAKLQGGLAKPESHRKLSKNSNIVLLSDDDDDVIYMGEVKNSPARSSDRSDRSSNPSYNLRKGEKIQRFSPPEEYSRQFSSRNDELINVTESKEIHRYSLPKISDKKRLDKERQSNVYRTNETVNCYDVKRQSKFYQTNETVNRKDVERHGQIKKNDEMLNYNNIDTISNNCKMNTDFSQTLLTPHLVKGEKITINEDTTRTDHTFSQKNPKGNVRLSDIESIFTEGNEIAGEIKEIQINEERLKKVYYNTIRKKTINKNLCIVNDLLCLNIEKLGTRIVISTVEKQILYYLHCLCGHRNESLPPILKKYFTPVKELQEKIKVIVDSCPFCLNGSVNMREEKEVLSSSTDNCHFEVHHRKASSNEKAFSNKLNYCEADNGKPLDHEVREKPILSLPLNSNDTGQECNISQSVKLLNSDKSEEIQFSSKIFIGSPQNSSIVDSTMKLPSVEAPSTGNSGSQTEAEKVPVKTQLKSPSIIPNKSKPVIHLSPKKEVKDPWSRVKEIQLLSENVSNIITKLQKGEDKTLYFLRNNLLLKRYCEEDRTTLKILIPDDKIKEIILAAHTEFSSHGDASNVISILKKNFAPIPDLVNIVKKTISACSQCSDKS